RSDRALDRLIDRIEHLGVAVDVDAAERERNPAGHRQGAERRLVDPVRPVRLRDGKSPGGLAVRPARIERLVIGDGAVEFLDRMREHFWLETDLYRELRNRGRVEVSHLV